MLRGFSVFQEIKIIFLCEWNNLIKKSKIMILKKVLNV